LSCSASSSVFALKNPHGEFSISPSFFVCQSQVKPYPLGSFLCAPMSSLVVVHGGPPHRPSSLVGHSPFLPSFLPSLLLI
jgi:hypothetical protein